MSGKAAADTSATAQHEKCLSVLELTVATNERVQKLVDSITDLGCAIPKDFLACRPCDAEISGGFLVNDASTKSQANKDYKPQIIMCENRIIERETFDNTLIHELVHAYDQCRAKLDWKNCLHHACTEVRASAQSGECSMFHELHRGKLTVRNGHQLCVQRRAEKSVDMNEHCKGIAADAVKAIFPQCYKDSSPFNR